MTDQELLDNILKQIKPKPSLWNEMRDKLGYSVDCCNEIIQVVEEWLPKEDPRPSFDTLQWDKCVRMIRSNLWEQTE